MNPMRSGSSTVPYGSVPAPRTFPPARAGAAAGPWAARGRAPRWPPRWSTDILRGFQLRYAVLAGLLLTYIWRFHDLTATVAQLRLAAVSTVASWAFLVFAPNVPQLRRLVKLPYVVCMLLWSAWIAVTAPAALSPEQTWAFVTSDHVKTVTLFLFVGTSLTHLSRVRWAMGVQAFGAGVLAFYYIKGGFSQWAMPVPMYDRNDFALLLAVGLPLVLYLAVSARRRLDRVLFGAMSLAVGVSVLFSQSRGGFITLTVITLLTLLRLESVKVRHRLLVPVTLLVGLWFAPPEVKERLSTLLDPSEDYNMTSDTGRWAIWQRGIGYFADRPVFGVGAINFPLADATLSDQARMFGTRFPKATHNSYLQVLVETGSVGFLLFLGMLTTATLGLLRLRKRHARAPETPVHREFVLCADFLLIALAAFCVGAFFLSLGYSPIMLALVATVAGLETSSRRFARNGGV